MHHKHTVYQNLQFCHDLGWSVIGIFPICVIEHNFWSSEEILSFFQLVNLGSMPWFLVEQFKIQDLVVTLPKGWFMPNITYQTELRRHHKSPPSLRWRKFIFVLKKFKNREFWTHAGFYFFPDHLENRCQLVMPVKKGLNLSWMGWMCRFLIAFMLTKIQHEEMSTFKRFFLHFLVLYFFSSFWRSKFSIRSSKLQNANIPQAAGQTSMSLRWFRRFRLLIDWKCCL